MSDTMGLTAAQAWYEEAFKTIQRSGQLSEEVAKYVDELESRFEGGHAAYQYDREQIDKRLAALEKEAADMKADMKALAKRSDLVRSDIGILNERIIALESRVTSLTKRADESVDRQETLFFDLFFRLKALESRAVQPEPPQPALDPVLVAIRDLYELLVPTDELKAELRSEWWRRTERGQIYSTWAANAAILSYGRGGS